MGAIGMTTVAQGETGRPMSSARANWRTHGREDSRDQALWVNSIQDAMRGSVLCCTVICEHRHTTCAIARSRTDSRMANLRDDLLKCGDPLPTLTSQEVLADLLTYLERHSPLEAELSDDGDGGLFAEWLVGGRRLTLSVDRLGFPTYRTFDRKSGWNDSTLDGFQRELAIMERRMRDAGLIS